MKVSPQSLQGGDLYDAGIFQGRSCKIFAHFLPRCTIDSSNGHDGIHHASTY